MAKLQPPPSYDVKIRRHALPPRWLIPSWSCTLPAYSSTAAAEQAIRWIHADCDVPPLRKLVQASMAFTTATPLASTCQTTSFGTASQEQLELFDRRMAA